MHLERNVAESATGDLLPGKEGQVVASGEGERV